MMEPLTDPAFSRAAAATMRKLITERIREMAPADFGELLRTATREDEWLLLAPRRGAGAGGRADPPGDVRMSLERQPPPRDGDLLGNAPALARVAAGLWWQATRWGLAQSARAGGRLARAAADPSRSAHVLDELGRELRGYARELLGITELDERVARLMPPPEAGSPDGAVSERRDCASAAPSCCARPRASTPTTGPIPPTPGSSPSWRPTRGGSCGCSRPTVRSHRSTCAPPT